MEAGMEMDDLRHENAGFQIAHALAQARQPIPADTIHQIIPSSPTSALTSDPKAIELGVDDLGSGPVSEMRFSGSLSTGPPITVSMFVIFTVTYTLSLEVNPRSAQRRLPRTSPGTWSAQLPSIPPYAFQNTLVSFWIQPTGLYGTANGLVRYNQRYCEISPTGL